MRLIIQPDYQSVSLWAAHYVAAKIKAANPTPEKPFVLGCPTGSSPLGMYKALIDLNKKGIVSFPECGNIQHGRICRIAERTSGKLLFFHVE